MPTYEYECGKCAHRFEQFQPITAKALSKCPKCSGKVRRLISAGAGILFKGSGFYQTDYRSEGYKKKADSEKKSSSVAAPEPKSSKPSSVSKSKD